MCCVLHLTNLVLLGTFFKVYNEDLPDDSEGEWDEENTSDNNDYELDSDFDDPDNDLDVSKAEKDAEDDANGKFCSLIYT